jgi:hypothetical protein
LENKIETLKDSDYFKNKLKNGKDTSTKWAVIFSQTSNNFQIYIPKEDYYLEVGSDRRGRIASREDAGSYLEIATDPPSVDSFRSCLISLIFEKISINLEGANTLIREYNEDSGGDIKELFLEDILLKVQERIQE